MKMMKNLYILLIYALLSSSSLGHINKSGFRMSGRILTRHLS